MKVASANAETETNQEFINYEKFHKSSVRTTDNGNRNIPVKKTETPNNGRDYQGKTYTKEEVVELIKEYSQQYGISSETPLAIARCESGFQQFAANKTSTAKSIFQYLNGTWANTPEGRAGHSVFDVDAHVRAAVRHISVHGTAPWNASKHCWNK